MINNTISSIYKGTILIKKVYKGLEKIWKKTLLPKEYQQVEYIESTGEQYIDTGTTINTETDTVEFSFQCMDKTLYKWVFGEHDNNARFGIGVGDGENKRNVAFGKNTYKVSDALLYNTKHTFISNNNGVFLDNTNVSSFASFNSTSTIYLFNLNLSGGNYRSKTRVWAYKHTRNNELIRDFIPCYRKTDNEVGLYDLVNNVFYTNKGNGEFVAGNAIQ